MIMCRLNKHKITKRNGIKRQSTCATCSDQSISKNTQ